MDSRSVKNKKAFLVAAPASGSGKTTIARGMMAMLALKGYHVQPFKCGPDYIDTKFHETVCGHPSINLDTFMTTPDHVRELFAHYGADADFCIVEGMMGLFDGYDRDCGSSAEIARILDIPVVLVVDAKSAAYSTAALLQGFLNFRKDVRFAGVIFNKVGSPKHVSILRQVCEDLGVPCLGCLLKDEELEQDSRYLGLDFSIIPQSFYLSQLLWKNLDREELLRQTVSTEETPGSHGGNPKFTPSKQKVLMAQNFESFSFFYRENVKRFSSVAFFDPEKDVPDFSGIDLLYLPGGYPEKHAEALTGNEACRKAIKDFVEQGGRVVAECGGMMYLCNNIMTDEGDYPMCGVLPYTITARQADRKLSLGYRRFELDGKEYRGHEFHYTQFYRGEGQDVRGEKMESAVQVFDAKGEPVDTPVLRYKNVLASYTHLYDISQFCV